MAKYLAVYNIHTQPFEEAPDDEKRNYDIDAKDEADAKKQAEKQKEILRRELLSGSSVTLERLVKVEDVKL